MPPNTSNIATAVFCLTLLGLPGNGNASDNTSKSGQAQAGGAGAVHPAVIIAKQMVGKPYRYGSASPEKGFDCSGLVYYSFKRAGINVPRTSDTQYRNAFPVDPSDLRQGDLLFFRIDGKVSHVGIFIGGDTFLHAPSSGKAVAYGSLKSDYWREHLIQAGRLF